MGIFVLIFVIVLLPLGYFAWLRVMWRRPPVLGKSVVVEYSPPADISPAEAAYLVDGQLKPHAAAAELLDLATRGQVEILSKDDRVCGLFWKNQNPNSRNIFSGSLLRAIFLNTTVVDKDVIRDRVTRGHYQMERALILDLRQRGLLAGLNFGTLILFGSVVVATGMLALGAWPYVGGFISFIFFLVAILCAQLSYMAINWRPRLTDQGEIMTRHLLGFREYLWTAEADRLRWQEREGERTLLMAYAVAFGIPLQALDHLRPLFEGLMDDVI